MVVGETEAGVIPGSFNGRPADVDSVPIIKNYEGLGDLVVGRTADTRVVIIALCMLNNPLVNQYLLDNKLKLSDRITKTAVFPREGMALPNGEVYTVPAVEENK
jgi:hypothetical protein